MSPATTCYTVALGSIEYGTALQLQMQICEMKKHGFAGDVLLLVEHPPTITLGRNGQWLHLLASEEVLTSRGVRCIEVDRGGDITFHGPGQLVAYPILELKNYERDVRRYMRNLEEVVLRLLSRYGIAGARHESLRGVWTQLGKVAALGVHISRWITRHGLALNVNTDLSFFDLIVPCGISEAGVSSMASVLGRQIDIEEVGQELIQVFGTVFERHTVAITREDLSNKLDRYAHEIAVA